MKKIILTYLFFQIIFCSFSLAQSSRVIIFNKIGQKEFIKNGESVNFVIDEKIKPELTYFAYTSGNNKSEFNIELKTIEPFLKEINNLKIQIDTLYKALQIKDETISNLKTEKDKKLLTPNALNELNNQTKQINDNINKNFLRRNNNYNLLEINKLNKKKDSINIELNNLNSILSKNNSTIAKNKNRIDTLISKIENIKLTGKNPNLINVYNNEIDSLQKVNNYLSLQNKELTELKEILQMELLKEAQIYDFLIKLLTSLLIIIFLIVILTFLIFRNYRQKKKFATELAAVNQQLENLNLELNNSNFQLKEQNTKISEQNTQLIELNNQKDKLLNIIKKDLQKASKYVYSLIPEPFDNDIVSVDWLFIPAVDLGGDTFGYNWLDDNSFAFYLVDVSGHGTGAALHSVQVLNILQNKALPNIDFNRPQEVMSALNKMFQMEAHNYIYFTMWYGVFDINSKKLTYSSAGHPPSILIKNSNKSILLESQNTFIGSSPKNTYISDSIEIERNSILLIFSDGVYEYEIEYGKMQKFNEFHQLALKMFSKKGSNLKELYNFAINASSQSSLEDDFTIIRIHFK